MFHRQMSKGDVLDGFSLFLFRDGVENSVFMVFLSQ